MEIGKKMRIKCCYLSSQLERKKHTKVLVLPCKYQSILKMLEELIGGRNLIWCQKFTAVINCPNPPLFTSKNVCQYLWQTCQKHGLHRVSKKEASFMTSGQMKDFGGKISLRGFFFSARYSSMRPVNPTFGLCYETFSKIFIVHKCFSANRFFMMNLRKCWFCFKLSWGNYRDCPWGRPANESLYSGWV